MAAAGGITDRDAKPAGEPVSFDEWSEQLHYEFTRCGISDWVDWPLDRVLLYWNEKLDRDAERIDQVNRHLAASRSSKVPPRLMYTLSIE